MSELWTGTYRLQMHKEFPLQSAIRVLPYLKKLGISHVYLSPCLEAAPGSTHGYDVTNPTRINPELGGEEHWKELTAALTQHDLGLLLDIVPNHMAASSCNDWWDDVLQHGPYSPYADFFDIRIGPADPFTIQLCTLGRPYGEALAAGDLQIQVNRGLPRVTYFDNSWPLSPRSWGQLSGSSSDPILHRASLPNAERGAYGDEDRRAYAAALRRAQQDLQQQSEQGTLAVRVEEINRDVNQLHALLQEQFYRLHTWKLSGELGNYRRFFDVDSLVGVRTELSHVMAATHARIERMVTNQELAGLRIDHPDGLRDPAAYFSSLRRMLPHGRIYIEKILENEERLHARWDVDGTVGYDFLSKVNRLWMDDQKVDALTATYFDFTQQSVNVAVMARRTKTDILARSFSSDLVRLSNALQALAERDWAARDLSPQQLREALGAVTVALPIYRTYRTAEHIDDYDRRVVSDAVQRARASSPAIDAAVFDFIGQLFVKESLDAPEADFVAKWQQLAPAVMAKGIEDTTFYRYDRLLSCNEVGASASLLGISNDKFHEYCHYLSDSWPDNLLASSTHDNKRSEDVRTRISILSEIPDRWADALHRWSVLTEPCWRNRTPDRHAEYLLYQTLIGAWPISKERAWQYMLKACREAKIRTSWHEPNVGYEANIQGFTEGVFEKAEFIASLEEFVAPLVMPGRINSLAQTLIKAVVPGVPDFYQGTELWDLILVDPDNRRPVDYEERSALLENCHPMSAADALTQWESGLPKMWLIKRLLRLRRERPAHFSRESKYQPLVAQGAKLSNLLAFRRGDGLIAIVPRFTLSINNEWGDTRLMLPDGAWRNVFSGSVARHMVTPAIFEEFPVALYLRDEAG